MNIELSESQRYVLVSKRVKLTMSRKELAEEAEIHLATLNRIENGKAKVVQESTIAKLCSALEIDFGEFVGVQPITHSEGVTNQKQILLRNKNNRAYLFIGLILSLLIISYVFVNNREKPIDWVVDTAYNYDVVTPEYEMWESKWIDGHGEIINFVMCDKSVSRGDSIFGEIQWSYHYGEGNPKIFLSWFSEWDPNNELRIWEGVLTGDGTQKCSFATKAPNKPGIYKVRIFYTKAFNPMKSFWGSPGTSQVYEPGSSKYAPIVIEIK